MPPQSSGAGALSVQADGVPYALVCVEDPLDLDGVLPAVADSPLRHVAAANMPSRRAAPATSILHQLEQTLHLTSREILNIIAERNRLGVALKGGMAEYKLEQMLRADRRVAPMQRVDASWSPDLAFAVADAKANGGRPA